MHRRAVPECLAVFPVHWRPRRPATDRCQRKILPRCGFRNRQTPRGAYRYLRHGPMPRSRQRSRQRSPPRWHRRAADTATPPATWHAREHATTTVTATIRGHASCRKDSELRSPPDHGRHCCRVVAPAAAFFSGREPPQSCGLHDDSSATCRYTPETTDTLHTRKSLVRSRETRRTRQVSASDR